MSDNQPSEEEEPEVVIVKMQPVSSGTSSSERSDSVSTDEDNNGQRRSWDPTISDWPTDPTSIQPHLPYLPIRHHPKVIIRPDPDDQTAYHESQEKWSLNNLPEILYILRPGNENVKSRARVYMTDYLVFGKLVRRFAVLPRQISSKVEAWRLEAWMRLDRRITEQDIIDRVNPRHRYAISADYIDYRRQFFREQFNVACWGSLKSINDIARRLRDFGIDVARNTTRGLTPGLIDPTKGEAGGRVPLPSETVCNIVSGLGCQPIPKHIGHAQRAQAMQRRYQPRHLMDYVPPPGSLAPSSLPIPFTGYPPIAHIPRYGRPAPQYMASYPIIYTNGKRKQTIEPSNYEDVAPRYKRQRLVAQSSLFLHSDYPFVPSELTRCHGPPARRFSLGDDRYSDVMGLEEYLDHNNLSLNEYFYARHGLKAHDVFRWA